LSNRSVNDHSNANSLNGSPNATTTAPFTNNISITTTAAMSATSLTSQSSKCVSTSKITSTSEIPQNYHKIQIIGDKSLICTTSDDKASKITEPKDTERPSRQDMGSSPHTPAQSHPVSPNVETKISDESAVGLNTPTSTISSDTLPLSLLQTNILIVVNKTKSSASSLGPFLDPQKVQALPQRFGPGSINRVLRRSVQELVDASLDQKQVNKSKSYPDARFEKNQKWVTNKISGYF
jgi:hypothetical protein